MFRETPPYAVAEFLSRSRGFGSEPGRFRASKLTLTAESEACEPTGQEGANEMAKRKKKTATRVVHVAASPRAPAAVIVRQSAPKPARRGRGRGQRRSPSLVSGGGIVSQPVLNGFIGGGAFGMLVKSGMVDKLPVVPLIGRTGLAAILLDQAAKRGLMPHLTRPAAVAAGVLAGYQLGHDGKITGDDLAGLSTSGDSFATAGDYQD